MRDRSKYRVLRIASPVRHSPQVPDPCGHAQQLNKISQQNSQNNHRDFSNIKFVPFATFENNRRRNMEKNSNYNRRDFGVVFLKESHFIGDQSSEWRHDGEGEHKEQNCRFVELTFDKKSSQNHRNRQMVNANAPSQTVVTIHWKTFQESVNAQTEKQQPRNLNHRFMPVHMSVFRTFREKF